MRRHLLAATAVAALVPAGAAVASVPPDSGPATEPAPPPSGEATAPTPSEPADTTAASTAPAESAAPAGSAPTDASAPAAAGEVTVYDDEGAAVATIAVGSTEAGWTDYGDDNAPEEGMEYFRATVMVTSMVPEGSFGVAIDDFVMQDAHGFLDTADNVPTAAQTESEEEIIEEADLANGESVELGLTFEVDPTVGAQSIFYFPDDDQLVDVAEVG